MIPHHRQLWPGCSEIVFGLGHRSQLVLEANLQEAAETSAEIVETAKEAVDDGKKLMAVPVASMLLPSPQPQCLPSSKHGSEGVL
jgi:hypothetical protein